MLNKARPRVNPFIDAEAGVDVDANGDENNENKENYYLNGFIVFNNKEVLLF